MTKEYVEFELIEKKPKTNVYHVKSKSSGDILGLIYWYNPWRQYVFEARKTTIWSNGCLEQVVDFLDNLMKERMGKK